MAFVLTIGDGRSLVELLTVAIIVLLLEIIGFGTVSFDLRIIDGLLLSIMFVG